MNVSDVIYEAIMENLPSGFDRKSISQYARVWAESAARELSTPATPAPRASRTAPNGRSGGGGIRPTYLKGDAEVAAYLGVTPRTVTNLVSRGRLRRHKIEGVRGNLYRVADVKALLGERAE